MKQEFIYNVVTMQTRNGKTIFMSVNDEKGGTFEWTFDSYDAIHFATEQDALEFGNKHFTNFKNWEVSEIKHVFNN